MDMKSIIRHIAEENNISYEEAERNLDHWWFNTTDDEKIKNIKEKLGNLYDNLNWID